MILLLARRFLLSKASDGFLSLISWVSMAGVALGVCALIVVTSVINGFEGELVRVITGMNGDVILYSRGEPISDPEKMEERVREVAPEVERLSRSFVSEMMVSGPAGVGGLVLEGADLRTLGLVSDLPKRLVEGEMPSHEGEIVLGQFLAQKIGARVGEEVRLISPFMGDLEEGTATGGEPRVLPAKVSGIFKMGMHDYDSKFGVASLESVQSFLHQPGRVTSFKLKLKKGTPSRPVSDRLGDRFAFPYRAKDWSQLNANLFYAIQLEKAVISIILTVIILVAAFNVVSTLMMMIHDKTKEIAILKAMGFGAQKSFLLFVFVGVGIGAVGTALGLGLGLGVSTLIAKTRLIQLPGDIYYISYLPVLVRWEEVFGIAVGTVLICLGATLVPAMQVARRPILEGIRYE